MPFIEGDERRQEDGQTFTRYSNFADTNKRPYYFGNQQNFVRIINISSETITVSVGSLDTVIQPERDASFTAISEFYIRGVSQGQKFIIEAWASSSSKLSAENDDLPVVILVFSESILGAGNFMALVQAALNQSATYLQEIYGGSHIPPAIASLSETLMPMYGGNAAVYSNSWGTPSSPGWQAADSGITITTEYQSDGTPWNKVVKADTSASQGPKHNVTYPSGAKGIFVSFEMMSLDGSMTNVNLSIYNASAAIEKATALTLEKGKKYKVCVWYPASAIPTWTAGQNVRIALQMNRNAAPIEFAPCIAHFSKLQVSFNGFENYTATGATAIAPSGTATWTKVDKHPYNFQDVDAVIVSYGRNEAPTVDPRAHYRAYDKLISLSLQMCSNVVIGNPPPQYDTTNKVFVAEASDPYSNKEKLIKKLAKKWNVGLVNVWRKLRVLVNSGKYTAQQLMSDASHQTEIGSGEMAIWYADELKVSRRANPVSPELKGESQYYLLGMPTGSWIMNMTGNAPENRSIGVGLYYQSSTQNDKLQYQIESGEYIGVLYREGNGNGTFQLIIDEGTTKERIYNKDTNATLSRLHGEFITDRLDPGTHTVTIKITSTSKPVQIHGIVAI